MIKFLRAVGVIWGVFMFLVYFAPAESIPSAVEKIFIVFLAATGVVLMLPFRRIGALIGAKWLSLALIVLVVLSFIFHVLMLRESGADIRNAFILFLIIYAVPIANIGVALKVQAYTNAAY